jgi:mono/diheme cytochrome c family protein
MLRLVALAGLLITSVLVQNSPTSSPRKDTEKGSAARAPIPYTAKSVTQGKRFYFVYCVACHDQDGKGLGRRDFNGTQPADLTDPDAWSHGTSPEAVFSNIREGTKDDMPPFKDKLTEEQVWHVVNFVRSLWPEPRRPKVEASDDAKEEGLRGKEKNR